MGVLRSEESEDVEEGEESVNRRRCCSLPPSTSCRRKNRCVRDIKTGIRLTGSLFNSDATRSI